MYRLFLLLLCRKIKTILKTHQINLIVFSIMVISDYFNKLPRRERSNFRSRVLEATGLSYPAFYNKLKNERWRKSELTAIFKIIKQSAHAE